MVQTRAFAGYDWVEACTTTFKSTGTVPVQELGVPYYGVPSKDLTDPKTTITTNRVPSNPPYPLPHIMSVFTKLLLIPEAPSRSPLPLVMTLVDEDGTPISITPDYISTGVLKVLHPGPLDRVSIFPGGRFPRQGRGQRLIVSANGVTLYRDRRLEDHSADRYVLHSSTSDRRESFTLTGATALWFRDTLREWAPGDSA